MSDDRTLIESPDRLAELAGELARVPRLAVDTEANGFHAYRPRLCLVQLAWEQGDEIRVALVDPLALRQDLGPLADVFADPRIEKVLHGADYDVRLLARDAGATIAGLFDTDIAARMVGWSRTGLSALAERILGRSLPKGAQRLDWARRPLPARALAYAADDVRVLLPIRDHLVAELERLGRRHWAEQAFRALERVRAAEEDDGAIDVDALLSRARGAGRLDPPARARLGEVLSWRETLARRLDRPAAFVAPTGPLVEAARRDVRDLDGLVRAGLPRRVVDRHGKAILAALDRGRRRPPRPLPRGRGEGPMSAEAAARLERLRRARAEAAARLELDPGLVCPSSLLKEIARTAPRSRDELVQAGLADWQVEALGDRLLRAVSGG
ncbi:MAG: ribonuclease D [Acidobacteriota bacterium]